MANDNWNRTVKIELNDKLLGTLEERAGKMAFLPEEYCALVLASWLQSGQTITITEK